MGRGHDMHLINKRREYSFPTAVGGQTKTTDLFRTAKAPREIMVMLYNAPAKFNGLAPPN